jgi:tripartite-type tricarboxylate transporter receptor subunit TctC
VIAKLTATLQEALTKEKLKEAFAKLGAQPVAADQAQPAALQAQVESEIAKWGPIIAEAGVYAE